MRSLVIVILAAALAAVAFLVWPRLEGSPPTLVAPESLRIGSAGAQVDVSWHDTGSGLRSVVAYLEMDTGARPLLRRTLHEASFDGSLLSGAVLPRESESASLRIDPAKMHLPDGEATLVLGARDWSWADALRGNAVEARIPVVIDTAPPRLAVDSGLTYVKRGGAAAVVYRASDDAVRHGVRVADAFFPGVTLRGRRNAAVFAIPIDAPHDAAVRVVAIDEAGNEASMRFDVRIQERTFPEVSIELSQRFLESVSNELAAANGLAGPDPVENFRAVNETLRARSEERIREAIPPASPKHWKGGFEQMHNSRVTSQFAELRDYIFHGRRVSRARHYGFDLASTAHAPITASNDGTVAFAGDNGIYGQLVLIDHGLGITTLYGHLSRIDVAVGEIVRKGQQIGRSGATGLAGGDHLHFAVLAASTYVDPIEWWDERWVREHIDVRVGDMEPGAR